MPTSKELVETITHSLMQKGIPEGFSIFLATFASEQLMTEALLKLSFAESTMLNAKRRVALPGHFSVQVMDAADRTFLLIGGSISEKERQELFGILNTHGHIETMFLPEGARAKLGLSDSKDRELAAREGTIDRQEQSLRVHKEEDTYEIQSEADTIDEAKKLLESQVPEGLGIVAYNVLADGRPKTVTGQGDSTEEAFTEAISRIPANTDIIEKREVTASECSIQTVEAFDEATAKRAVRGGFVQNVKLVTPGSKGVLGIGKKPNRYEIEVIRRAAVEVTYKTQAKVAAKVGKAQEPEQSSKMTQQQPPSGGTEVAGKSEQTPHASTELKCVHCDGSGREPESMSSISDQVQYRPCRFCQGTGKVSAVKSSFTKYPDESLRLAHQLIQKHGKPAGVCIAGNHDIRVLFQDGSTYILGGFAAGYRGTGPDYLKSFLNVAGFNITIDDIADMQPPVTLFAEQPYVP